MSILRVNGMVPLSGDVKIQGAKNSVLPILAASILSNDETVIHNCPNLSDVDAAVKILEHLGCKVVRSGEEICVDSRSISRCDIPDRLMREMRSSVIFLGAILARMGKAVLSLPGGCELGPRPIDMHLSSLRQMGAEIREKNGNIICRAGKINGSRINLKIPSVGATENIILASVHCDGETVITNAAREPEIVDLQNFLVKLGANITGAGSSTVVIKGKKFSGAAEYRVISDRIAAATYLSAAVLAGGRICVKDVCTSHVSTVTDVFSEMGCSVRLYEKENIIDISSSGTLKAVKPISTLPYPRFPTDAQPPLMAAALKAEGTTVFIENIFENRYRHIDELLRMGADIKTEGRVAMVSGVKALHGAPVSSADLRGGAALVIAALGADGVSDISQIQHIDRGYDNIEGHLRQLGADIRRID